MSSSMLQYLDKSDTTEQQLEEAFCRDIDAFNSLFIVSNNFRVIEDNLKLQTEVDILLYDFF